MASKGFRRLTVSFQKSPSSMRIGGVKVWAVNKDISSYFIFLNRLLCELPWSNDPSCYFGPKFTNSAVDNFGGNVLRVKVPSGATLGSFGKVSKGRGGFCFRSKAMLHCTDCLVVVYDMHSLPCSLPTSLDDSLIATLITAAQMRIVQWDN